MPPVTFASSDLRPAEPGVIEVNPKTPFEEAAEEADLSLPQEFWLFLKHHKKWWLLPIVLVLLAMAALGILTASGAAPFIYTFG